MKKELEIIEDDELSKLIKAAFKYEKLCANALKIQKSTFADNKKKKTPEFLKRLVDVGVKIPRKYWDESYIPDQNNIPNFIVSEKTIEGDLYKLITKLNGEIKNLNYEIENLKTKLEEKQKRIDKLTDKLLEIDHKKQRERVQSSPNG